jgi:membrane protein YqaA with SNARE-associated domain
MPNHVDLLLAVNIVASVRHLGGLGLVLVAVVDNSFVPLPGSLDVFTIWLAASHPDLWFYYAAMAIVGSLIGAYITYALARKGGKEALENRMSRKKAEKVFRRVEGWGFWGVAISAIMPPPFPLVPVLVAAGALQYSRKKFLGALALGRGVRYCVVAGLGAIYGDPIVSFFSKYYKPALYTLIGLAVIGGILALVQYLNYRKRRSDATQGRSARKAA